MTTAVTPSRSTACHSSCASNDRFVSVTTVPFISSGAIVPSHMPVPCICGQAASHTGGSVELVARVRAAPRPFVGGAPHPVIAAPKPASAIGKTPCAYITPFGMPVVPPV